VAEEASCGPAPGRVLAAPHHAGPVGAVRSGADDGHRQRTRLGGELHVIVDTLHLAHLGQGLEQRRCRIDEGRVPAGQQRHALGR